jgi:hypothetical protein
MVAEALRTPAASGGPELSFVRSMKEPFGRWERKGDYAIWTGSRQADEPRVLLLELHDKGVVPIVKSDSTPLMHRIPGGVPHHIAHLFGFWHVADVDSVWLQAKQGDVEYYSLMLGGAAGRPAKDSCLWICPKCATLLVRHDFDTARNGFEAFLRFSLDKVRAFNRDAAERTCRSCGAVHPPAHGFYPDEDNDEERVARLAE